MSRLAIFSDVHGNESAFDACLDDAEAQGATEYLCLGDQSNFGPQPAQTLEKLKMMNCPVVMGNTDQRLLEPRTLADFKNDDEDAKLKHDIETWCAAQLDENHKAFIKTFKPYIELEFQSLKILAYHGSPQSFNDTIVPTTSLETLDDFFSDLTADIYVGGHTHVQFIKPYHRNRLMNPGSVGQAHVKVSGRYILQPEVAEYLLLNVVSGEPNVTLRRVPYKLTELEQEVKASDMPHRKRWLEEFKQA